MTEEKNEEIIIKKSSTRFGWKDLILNSIFSCVMIASIVVFVFVYVEEDRDLTGWFTIILVTVLPLLIFGNRVIREIIYKWDFITIAGTTIKYRSTPLLFTGVRTKKGEVDLRSVRKFGVARIPRKFSLDMRKNKKKGMLILNLRDGKELIFGEYFSNEDLVEICVVIKKIYPKAKLVTNLAQEYPELEYLQKKISSTKKIQEIDDEDEEPEGVNIRRS